MMLSSLVVASSLPALYADDDLLLRLDLLLEGVGGLLDLPLDVALRDRLHHPAHLVDLGDLVDAGKERRSGHEGDERGSGRGAGVEHEDLHLPVARVTEQERLTARRVPTSSRGVNLIGFEHGHSVAPIRLAARPASLLQLIGRGETVPGPGRVAAGRRTAR